MPIIRNFLYRDMKCGRICLSHGGQLPVLHRRKGSQHFMNQAKFHSTFPILLLLKSLIPPRAQSFTHLVYSGSCQSFEFEF